MSFRDLSNEILVQIISDGSITQDDLFQIITTCHRFYAIGLPFLYTRITQEFHFITTPRSGARTCVPRHRDTFRRFTEGMVAHPERIDWIKEADFSCHVEDFKLLTNIFTLVLQFKSLRTLRLMSNIAHLAGTKNRTLQTASPFLSLPYHADSLPYLASLTIQYRTITHKQIAEFFGMKTLKHLRIDKFGYTVFYPPNMRGHSYTSNLEKLEFRLAGSPEGLAVQHLLTGHPHLQDFTWEYDPGTYITERGAIFAAKIEETFMPLRLMVSKMQLSTATNLDNGGNDMTSCAVDFSKYLCLKELQVTMRFILCGISGSLDKDARHIGERLPASLESLTIVFDAGADPFGMYARDETRLYHTWLNSLALHKVICNTKLSSVTVLSTKMWHPVLPLSTETVIRKGGIEWEQPGDLKEAFSKAYIELRVVLNKNNLLS